MSEKPHKRFAGVFARNGTMRRIEFDAENLEEAVAIAKDWNVGVEGETTANLPVAPALPEAYDLPTTCRLLGGVCRGTIYRWLIVGDLERVPNCRKVLITRRSIEKRAAGVRVDL